MSSGNAMGPICVTCGRSEVLEAHHPVGRARVLNATVPLCRRCHNEQSERQRDAGVELTAASPSAREDLWAFAIGFQSLLSAYAQSIAGGAVDERAERAFMGLVREVIRTCPQEPEAGVGPDPITNAVRDARRTRSRRRRKARPKIATTEQESVEIACVGVCALIEALATVVDQMLGTEEPQDAFLQALKQITTAPHTLPLRLQDLDGHPRLADVAAITERDRELQCELLDGLATADPSRVPDSLRVLGARFAQSEATYLTLLTGLAAAADRSAAIAAFEQFLDQSALA
jgi:hypothetical protein